MIQNAPQPSFANISRGPLRNPFRSKHEPGSFALGCTFLRWLHHQPDVLHLASEMDRERLSPDERSFISEMESGALPSAPPSPVFVFGSNLRGAHGKGAAEFARLAHGAENGVGRGRTGSAWAIPTKDESLSPRELPAVLEEIADFMERARDSEETFRFTRVGCGLAGLDEHSIREHVLEARPENVELPGLWLAHEDSGIKRVIVAGSRDFNDRERAFRALDKVVERLGAVEIVSGGADGADELGEQYAVANELTLRRFPARWDLLGKSAGYWRNHQMAWYSTHLVAFHKGQSRGTAHMIRIAEASGLKSAVIRA